LPYLNLNYEEEEKEIATNVRRPKIRKGVTPDLNVSIKTSKEATYGRGWGK